MRNPRQVRIGALEVTTTVVGELAALRSIETTQPASEARLGFDWFLVTRDSRVNLGSLAQTLGPLLVDAERQGLVAKMPVFEPTFYFTDGDELLASLSNFGIWMMTALPVANGMPGKILVNTPSQVGEVGWEMVTEAVQLELERGDNLAKLMTVSDGEKAELFVWLDEGSAGMTLISPLLFPQLESALPSDGPTLPEPVTRVWAATGPNDADVLARGLWVADGGMWSVLTSPLRLA